MVAQNSFHVAIQAFFQGAVSKWRAFKHLDNNELAISEVFTPMIHAVVY